MYNYEGLEKLLRKHNLNKSDLTTLLNISSRTIAKIAKGEKIADRVLQKICNYFSCSIDDLYHIISSNPILQRLREEKEYKISGGLYHELLIRLTYNSNRIEGSKLSEEETRYIFDTNNINAKGLLEVNDITETINHFLAVNYCIDIAEELLSEEIILNLHLILKRGTRDEALSWFRAGEYKLYPNVVGGYETAAPEKVAEEVQKLLSAYNKKNKHSLGDIIEFHYRFERIHPFQDGNGRVGRLIAFKECLKNNIVPFIIEDSKKYYYYHGLAKYADEPGFLIDTCLDGQDTFRKLLKKFDVQIS